jgi:hypothetical protein
LHLPVQFGDGDAAVRAIGAGAIHIADYPDGTMHLMSFDIRTPDLYHLQAVVHVTGGLLKLEIRRPDLVEANQCGDERAGGTRHPYSN